MHAACKFVCLMAKYSDTHITIVPSLLPMFYK